MLQCCLTTHHKEIWHAHLQKCTKHTDWNDRTDECTSILSLYIYCPENIYIFIDLLYFSMEILHLHVESLRFYLFHIYDNISWIEKYIVHSAIFCLLCLNCFEEKKIISYFQKYDEFQLISQSSFLKLMVVVMVGSRRNKQFKDCIRLSYFQQPISILHVDHPS